MKENKISLCFVVLILFLVCSVCRADPVRTTTWITFAWDAVTENADGTPCDDLAGYTIYRSRVSGQWDGETGKEAAFQVIMLADGTNQSRHSCWCYDGGDWFWMMRAFDKTGQFSAASNEVACFIDTAAPGSVINFKVVKPGDLNNDGNVDGKDLAIMSKNFGAVAYDLPTKE